MTTLREIKPAIRTYLTTATDEQLVVLADDCRQGPGGVPFCDGRRCLVGHVGGLDGTVGTGTGQALAAEGAYCKLGRIGVPDKYQGISAVAEWGRNGYRVRRLLPMVLGEIRRRNQLAQPTGWRPAPLLVTTTITEDRQ